MGAGPRKTEIAYRLLVPMPPNIIAILPHLTNIMGLLYRLARKEARETFLRQESPGLFYVLDRVELSSRGRERGGWRFGEVEVRALEYIWWVVQPIRKRYNRDPFR